MDLKPQQRVKLKGALPPNTIVNGVADMAAEPPVFPRLVDRIDKVSDVMMADLLEWQTIFRARPLSLPA